MSIEEIIKNLQHMVTTCDAGATVVWDKWIETAREVIAKLKTNQDYQPNEPLTREDLLEMHGEPAYLSWPDGGEWVLIRVVSPDREKVELAHRNGILAPVQFVFDGGGKLYRRPPKEETP